MKNVSSRCLFVLFTAAILACGTASHAQNYREFIFNLGTLKPFDSELKVEVGQTAPDFSLPSVSGPRISLAQFRGKKNVVLSFVPAAWTPVCTEQWPGYNHIKPLLDEHNATLIGISVDNTPTLFAWTRQMGGLWFPVLSDFWPHGAVADRYGVLRTDGVAERALFVVDTEGILRLVHVENINQRPKLELIIRALEKIDE